jgi:hypothetical protein
MSGTSWADSDDGRDRAINAFIATSNRAIKVINGEQARFSSDDFDTFEVVKGFAANLGKAIVKSVPGANLVINVIDGADNWRGDLQKRLENQAETIARNAVSEIQRHQDAVERMERLGKCKAEYFRSQAEEIEPILSKAMDALARLEEHG